MVGQAGSRTCESPITRLVCSEPGHLNRGRILRTAIHDVKSKKPGDEPGLCVLGVRPHYASLVKFKLNPALTPLLTLRPRAAVWLWFMPPEPEIPPPALM